jgi:hypothetical protein
MRRLVERGRLDPQRRAGAGHASADPRPGDAPDHHGRLTAGQAADLLDDRRGADRAVGAVEPGDRQQGVVAAAPRAASTGAWVLESSVSGITMPGSNTASVNGRTGRVVNVRLCNHVISESPRLAAAIPSMFPALATGGRDPRADR